MACRSLVSQTILGFSLKRLKVPYRSCEAVESQGQQCKALLRLKLGCIGDIIYVFVLGIYILLL